MPDSITKLGQHTFIVEADTSSEIVCTLELTERQKELLEVVLAIRFQEYRKLGATTSMALIVELLVKLDPRNAETYADKPGDDEPEEELLGVINQHKNSNGNWCRWSSCSISAEKTRCPFDCKDSKVTVPGGEK